MDIAVFIRKNIFKLLIFRLLGVGFYMREDFILRIEFLFCLNT